ncbi:hypothetical protein D3C77_610960 [compost metagenome]
MVKIIILVSGKSSLILAIAIRPLSPGGMLKSIKRISGWCNDTILYASIPSTAVATTSISSWKLIIIENPLLTTA